MSRARLAPIARWALRLIAPVVVLLLLPPKAIDWIGWNPDHVPYLAVGKCLDKGDEVVACGHRAAAYKLVAEVDSDSDCPGETADTWEGGPVLPLLFHESLYCGVALK